MLRRVRLGLLLDSGGLKHMDRIKRLLSPALPWDHNRWTEELERYSKLWTRCYAPPQE
jgi:glycerol-3-phosphate dehydrogenase